MPHIHTEAGQIDHTVTAYIVRDDFDEPKILLHMHKKLSVLLPVGGNETPWSALAHEVEEESGFALDQLDVLQAPDGISIDIDNVAIHPVPIFVNTHSISSDHMHSDIAYALLAHEEARVQLADGESTDIRWLTREEVTSLDERVIYDNTSLVVEAIFDEVLPKWERLPAISFTTDLPKE